jgi:hypothetical protein
VVQFSISSLVLVLVLVVIVVLVLVRVSSAKGVHLAGNLLPVTKTEKCTRCVQGIARNPI